MIEGSCHCGAVRWTYDGEPEGATACNCTVCRRYGVLWIYGYEDQGVRVAGPTKAYARGAAIDFNFCPTCGCVVSWRGRIAEPDGRRRLAVNLRLADDPDRVGDIPIDHFDGLNTFDDLPRDGRRVVDYWF